MKIKKAMLVYQAGIANVFQVDSFNINPYGRNAKRLLQHAFSACEWYCRGLEQAGITIHAASCNRGGDIKDLVWTFDLDAAPFSEKFSLSPKWAL